MGSGQKLLAQKSQQPSHLFHHSREAVRCVRETAGRVSEQVSLSLLWHHAPTVTGLCSVELYLRALSRFGGQVLPSARGPGLGPGRLHQTALSPPAQSAVDLSAHTDAVLPRIRRPLPIAAAALSELLLSLRKLLHCALPRRRLQSTRRLSVERSISEHRLHLHHRHHRHHRQWAAVPATVLQLWQRSEYEPQRNADHADHGLQYLAERAEHGVETQLGGQQPLRHQYAVGAGATPLSYHCTSSTFSFGSCALESTIRTRTTLLSLIMAPTVYPTHHQSTLDYSPLHIYFIAVVFSSFSFSFTFVCPKTCVQYSFMLFRTSAPVTRTCHYCILLWVDKTASHFFHIFPLLHTFCKVFVQINYAFISNL